MAEETVVGIHPHKAAALATELRHVARQLIDHATVTFDALTQGLEDGSLIVPLCDATEWFGAQGRALQRVLDDVMQAFADPGVAPPAGVEVWHQPYALSFDNPTAAVEAAHEAGGLVAALLGTSEGDATAEERVAALSATWRGNEVFAVVLAASLPTAAVADLLRLEATWRRAGADGGSAATRARTGVFATLATASLSGLLPFRVADLVAELAGHADAPVPADAQLLAPLGLLFTSGSAWDDGFLLDAVHQYLVPLNRSGGAQSVAPRLGGDDPRIGLLDAVAANASVATALLAEPGAFDDLFAARFGYGDGGRALAEVLRTGTDPASAMPPADVASREPDARATNMMRFVWWVLQHQDLPPVTRALLGSVTAPWVGSFRSPARDDDPTMGNPLAALTDETRIAYLHYVTDDLDALQDLRVSELAWVRRSVLGLGGAGFDGRGLGLLANVDRRTSAAAREGMLHNLEREDDRIDFDKQVWGYLASFLAYPLRSGVDVVVDAAIHVAGDIITPTSNLAFDHARAFPTMLASDDHKLQQSVLVALWERRAENHVFDDVAPAPASIVMGEPPRLLEVAEMTPADFDDWIAWIDDNDLRRRAHWDQLTVGAGG